jgi:hypothetical protein
MSKFENETAEDVAIVAFRSMQHRYAKCGYTLDVEMLDRAIFYARARKENAETATLAAALDTGSGDTLEAALAEIARLSNDCVKLRSGLGLSLTNQNIHHADEVEIEVAREIYQDTVEYSY